MHDQPGKTMDGPLGYAEVDGCSCMELWGL